MSYHTLSHVSVRIKWTQEIILQQLFEHAIFLLVRSQKYNNCMLKCTEVFNFLKNKLPEDGSRNRNMWHNLARGLHLTPQSDTLTRDRLVTETATCIKSIFNRHISMAPLGNKPTTPPSVRPQTYALDCRPQGSANMCILEWKFFYKLKFF
jgi:hypothetical protein